MSADNGIYILETKRDENSSEYRVAYAQAIDNIFGKFNDDTYHWEPNLEMMKNYFGNSSVHDNLIDALDKAEKMSYDYEYLEDGVCVLSDFSEIPFPQD